MERSSRRLDDGIRMCVETGWSRSFVVLTANFSDMISIALMHMCHTQACGPNLARHVIIVVPRGNIKRALGWPAEYTVPLMLQIPQRIANTTDEALKKLLVKSTKQKINILVSE